MMKRILLIATGGTIASSDSVDGLTPKIDAEKLLSYIPDIKNICYIDGMSIMCIDSTEMSPKRMAQIAETIENHYCNYDGFVVTHGTDTLAYTSAALTYMLQNLDKPVVITGSQLAMEAPNTDAKKNISDAFIFATQDVRGVYVAFNGKIINGTRAMKVKTKSLDGFASINYPIVATIECGKVNYQKYLSDRGRQVKREQSFKASVNLCDKVFVLKLYPGINSEIFTFIKEHYKGVVIESFGVGGIPSYEQNILSKVKELILLGIVVVITTQCLEEGIDLSVYKVGTKLNKLDVIYSSDMTTEAIVMKLMWALGYYKTFKEIKNFMETVIQEDISVKV